MTEERLKSRLKKLGWQVKILSNDGLNLSLEIFHSEHGALHTKVRVDILTSEEAYKDWLESLKIDYPHLFGE